MATNGNVYGSPITDDFLATMPKYTDRQIKKRDRAQVAMFFKNRENKHDVARQRVEELKKQWGDSVSTLCLVYNATGDTIKLTDSKDWEGHFGSECPKKIENGQWAVFVHVNSKGSPGSKAAVVYRDTNENGDKHDWMLSWHNPCNDFCFDKVYTEAREVTHYNNDATWNTVKEIVNNLNAPIVHHQDTYNECMSTVTIRNYTSPMVEAVFVVT